MKPRVVVLFDTIGPYHDARLKAAAHRLDIVPLEARAKSRIYAWDDLPSAASARIALADADAPVSWRRALDGLERHIAPLRPEAIAVPGWSSMAALASIAWAARAGLPVIAMSDSNEHDFARSAPKEFIKRRIVRAFAAGLTGSAAQKAYLSSLGLDPAAIFLGYDVVDNDHFATVGRRAKANPSAEPLRFGLVPGRFFLTVARMVEKKNLSRLVAAHAAYARAAAPDDVWPLVILGDGPERSALVRQCTELGTDQLVHMPGFRQYDAIPEWYGLAGASVLPSAREQWGLVVNEAMACGLPVLVSKQCGCASSLVHEGRNGWTFDASDTMEIRDALTRLATLPPAHLEALGRQSGKIIAEFGVERFGDGLANAVAHARSRGAPRVPSLTALCVRVAASIQEARSLKGIE